MWQYDQNEMYLANNRSNWSIYVGRVRTSEERVTVSPCSGVTRWNGGGGRHFQNQRDEKLRTFLFANHQSYFLIIFFCEWPCYLCHTFLSFDYQDWNHAMLICKKCFHLMSIFLTPVRMFSLSNIQIRALAYPQRRKKNGFQSEMCVCMCVYLFVGSTLTWGHVWSLRYLLNITVLLHNPRKQKYEVFIIKKTNLGQQNE